MESDSDLEINTKTEEIIKKIQSSLVKLEKSSFFAEFLKQVKNPEMMERIERVIGTDPHYSQLQVVLYGVGKMEPNAKNTYTDTDIEHNHVQLCLALLLRKTFEWVHDIVVYDPVLSKAEQKAIIAFDCIFLSVNENGRRTVNRPTLFFMPHCELPLTDRVLEANWTHENLNKIIILGNSLKFYDLRKEYFPYYRITRKVQVILDSEHMLHEVPLSYTGISIEKLYVRSFHDLSWHFFDWDGSLHGFQRQDPQIVTRAFASTDDNRTVGELIKKIHEGRKKLKKSSFYRKFTAQMQDPEVVTRIENVRRTDPHHSDVQLVVHGIGIAKPHYEMMQIAFAILLREKFDWVNEIVVYGQSFSSVEIEVMKALDCSFLSGIKREKWSVDRPTLFFMPGTQMQEFLDLVEANWTPAKLNKFIILGESIKHFTHRFGTDKSIVTIDNNQILHEMPLPQTVTTIQQDGSTPPNQDYSVDPDPVYTKAFGGLSLHFFNWDRLFQVVGSMDVYSFFGCLRTSYVFLPPPHIP